MGSGGTAQPSMSWRSWFASTFVYALALSACGGASPAPAPQPEPEPAPRIEAPAEPVAVGATPAAELPKTEVAQPAPEPAEAQQEPLAAEPQAEEQAEEAVEEVAETPETAPQEEPAKTAAAEEAAADEVPDEVPAEARNPWLDDPRLEGMFVFDRGPGRLPVAVARGEVLTMNVRVKLGIAGSPRLGTVTLTSRVVPHRASLLRRDAEVDTALERAELIAVAKGGNALYQLIEERKSLLLPQAWPHIRHTSVQTGSENRKRQQDHGWGEDGYHTRYRKDHHCGGCKLQQHFVEPTWSWQDPRHCRKCKRAEHRVWREWRDRPIPEDSVDMVTAVMLGRTMLLLDQDEMTFPLIDEEKLWELHIRRGRSERIDVDAGEFDATEILLDTQPAEGEDSDPEDFKGLFGIHGTVSIWFDSKTGVPVRISGVVPLGPFTLDARVELATFRGTPAGFAPVR